MKLTNRSPQYLSELGRRLRVNSLLSQAHATHRAASEDQLVSANLGPAFLAEMKAAIERLETSVRDRRVVEDLAKRATAHQDAAMTDAVAWRRAFTAHARRALRRGIDIPADAASVRRVSSPAAMAVEVDRLVEHGTKFLKPLSAVGVAPALLAQGTEAAAALRASDEAQENLRRNVRAEAVKRMHEQMALVYHLVKEVVDAARTVHTRDRVKRRMFNLDILNGRASAKSGAPPGEAPAA